MQQIVKTQRLLCFQDVLSFKRRAKPVSLPRLIQKPVKPPNELNANPVVPSEKPRTWQQFGIKLSYKCRCIILLLFALITQNIKTIFSTYPLLKAWMPLA
jgi:hypothetical protein